MEETLYEELLRDLEDKPKVYENSHCQYEIYPDFDFGYIVSVFDDRVEIEQEGDYEVITDKELIDRLLGEIENRYMEFLFEAEAEEEDKLEEIIKEYTEEELDEDEIRDRYYMYLVEEYGEGVADRIYPFLIDTLLDLKEKEVK